MKTINIDIAKLIIYLAKLQQQNPTLESVLSLLTVLAYRSSICCFYITESPLKGWCCGAQILYLRFISWTYLMMTGSLSSLPTPVVFFILL